MIELEVNNLTACRPPLKQIRDLLAAARARLALRRKQKISLAFVGPREMRGLNRACRGKDYVTDVLSFGNGNGFCGEDTIGEIIICPAKARAGAREFGHTLNNEILKLVLHGYLHLLGFDHERGPEASRMEAFERKILNEYYG